MKLPEGRIYGDDERYDSQLVELELVDCETREEFIRSLRELNDIIQFKKFIYQDHKHIFIVTLQELIEGE